MPEMIMQMETSPPNRRAHKPKEYCVLIVGQSFSVLRDALKEKLPNVILQGLIDNLSASKIRKNEVELIIFDTSFFNRHSRNYCVNRLRKEFGKKIPVIFISIGPMFVIDLVTARMESGHPVFNPTMPGDIKEIVKLAQQILKTEGEKNE